MTAIATEPLFCFDPKKARPERLRNTLRLIAQEVEHCLGVMGRYMGRPTHRCLFVTLTYAKNTKGNARDVSELLNRIRDWLARQGEPMCPYLWVAELQKRGALHYHLMIWWPRGLLLPKLDRRGWWKHGMTKVETARNPIAYMVKYASKFKDDITRFRKGTRLHGHGGLPPDVLRRVRQACWPRWARKAREAQRDAACMAEIEREIAAQEREEAAMLHDVFPDQYPPPDPVDEEAEYDAYIEREVEEREKQERWQEIVRRGRLEFAPCAGGYVDRLTGERFESPYEVSFEHGLLVVRPKDRQADDLAELQRCLGSMEVRSEAACREVSPLPPVLRNPW